jgi:hypothetical protein
MVPEERVEDAIELIREFQAHPSELDSNARPRLIGVLRNLVELFLFGWFVPGRKLHKVSDGTPNNRLQRAGEE